MIRLSDHVRGERLWQRLMALARFGATGDGGVDRLTLTPAEHAARAELVRWGREIGLEPYTDAAANLFLRLPGREPRQPPILSGSHIDTQPSGGRFDGVYGVIAALEVASAIRDAGRVPRRAIEIVAWTNEEAARFTPGMTGSELFRGVKTVEDVAEIRDAHGVRLGDALAAELAADVGVPSRPFGWPVGAYVEAHIEQGPILERNRVQVGIVTGIQGARQYRVNVTGAAAHAGTAERHERRDALMAATRMIAAIDRSAEAVRPDAKLTVGLVKVTPNAPSVVPAAVEFSIDLRHPDNWVMDAVDAAIRRVVVAERGPCEVAIRQTQHDPSVAFPPPMRAALTACARSLGISCQDILSSAGHDARHLSYVCPSGMIFVPCRDGISHNPAEWSEPADLEAGARVLADVLWQLADEL